MAILSVTEMLGARSGGIDAQWNRTYRRSWRIVTDGPLAIGPLGARSAIPVTFGQVYSLKDNTGAVVEYDNWSLALACNAQIDPDCNDDCSWVVTVEYGPYDPTEFPENPLNHPVKVSWNGNRFERVVFIDANGNPVLNSAGDYFDPPLMADDSRPMLRIVRNEQLYNPTYANLWKDTVNLDVFWGFDAGTVKLAFPNGDLEFSPVCGFYDVVTYEFEVNANGWVKQILDQGMRQIVSGKKVKILDDAGAAVDSPALLNGAGKKLATGGAPVFLPFTVYQTADFSALNLPQPSARARRALFDPHGTGRPQGWRT
jgi:hypothetical protein